MNDVQAAFHWSGPVAQAKIKGVNFSYESTDTYSYVCRAEKAEGIQKEKKYSISINARTDVVSALKIEERENGHLVTAGFDLMGFQGNGTVSGQVPQLGDPCPENNGKGTVSKVELVEAQDRLLIKFGDKKVPIWNFPKNEEHDQTRINRDNSLPIYQR